MDRTQSRDRNKHSKRIFKLILNILAFTWIHAYDVLKKSDSTETWRKNKAAELQFVSVTVGLAYTPRLVISLF